MPGKAAAVSKNSHMMNIGLRKMMDTNTEVTLRVILELDACAFSTYTEVIGRPQTVSKIEVVGLFFDFLTLSEAIQLRFVGLFISPHFEVIMFVF